jgi:hypothetical protein
VDRTARWLSSTGVELAMKMKTFVLLAGSIVVASASLLAGQGEGGDTPSIKDVMNKLHKGAKSPLAQFKTALKSESPDWSSLEKSSKDFVILGAALAKNNPPKGEKASWEKLSNLYFEDAKALDNAVKEHDLAAARKAHQRLAASCKACHGAHKGKAQ